MNSEELAKYAQENGERFWKDAGEHWLNDRLDLHAYNRVIEAGGYLGDWTNYIHHRFQCFVDVYEPVPEFAERLKRRFSHTSKVEVMESALGRANQQEHIAVMNDGSSFHNGYPAEGPIVHVLDASEVVRRNYVVDLLALNCEGSEYNILDRLVETGAIENVRQLLVQFHAFYPDAEAKRNEIKNGLSRTHGEVFSYPFCWEIWRRNGTGS